MEKVRFGRDGGVDIPPQSQYVFHTVCFQAGQKSVYLLPAGRHTDVYKRQVLFRRADRALYEAKRQGRNCYCFYDDSMKDMRSVLSPIESDSNPDYLEKNERPKV